jgi:hypothetical protein
MAVVLLSGATLLTASFARLIRVDPGFDADRVIAVRLGGLPPEYDAPRRERLVDRLLERVRALPGVEHAAAAPSLPLERGLNFPVDIPERPELAIGAVELRYLSADYFATLGVVAQRRRVALNAGAVGVNTAVGRTDVRYEVWRGFGSLRRAPSPQSACCPVGDCGFRSV